MSERVLIITQGVSRIVEPVVNNANVVGIVESRSRIKQKKNLINFFSQKYSYYINNSKNLKSYCHKRKVPYYFMENGCDNALQTWIEDLKPDVIVVYLMSELLKENIFTIPTYGTINLHPSFLPKYRGPNPWFWSYYNMDKRGGVTLHFINPKEDLGDIIYQEEYDIPLGIESPKMQDLAIGEIGVKLILKALKNVKDLPRLTQEKESPTKRARNIKRKEHLEIVQWEEWPIERIWHLLRGTQLWLNAFEQPKGIYKGQRWVIGVYEKCNMSDYSVSKVYKNSDGYFLCCKEGKIHLSISFGVKSFFKGVL